MIKKILTTKAYAFIGTLITAGVITVTGYNMILGNSEKQVQTTSKDTDSIQQIDYSNDIVELKQRLDNTESKVTELEEKISLLESDNQKKNETISNLQSRIDSLKNENDNKNNQINDLKKQVTNTQNDLNQTKEVLEKRSKRLSEIQARLAETAKMPQNYESIGMEIKYLKSQEQTEDVVEEIQKLEIEYNNAKTVHDEVMALNEEMRQLLYGEIEL